MTKTNLKKCVQNLKRLPMYVLRNIASQKKQIKGVVEASQFKWTFTWSFNNGLLKVNPPLGRALIEDALLRFLLKKDYELEAGSEYKFIISAKW